MGQTKSRGWSPNCSHCSSFIVVTSGPCPKDSWSCHSSSNICNMPPLLGHLCSPPFATILLAEETLNRHRRALPLGPSLTVHRRMFTYLF